MADGPLHADIRAPMRSPPGTPPNSRSAFRELLDREFGWSTGPLATLLNGCVFAPSLLTVWLVNGVLGFSTAFAIGSPASPGGLGVRLVAYVLLVSVYPGLRSGHYLVHARHRRTVLAESYPRSRFISLDWFGVGSP